MAADLRRQMRRELVDLAWAGALILFIVAGWAAIMRLA